MLRPEIRDARVAEPAGLRYLGILDAMTEWEPTRYVSPDELIDNQTPKGGFTQAVLAEWGVPWPPPKGWKKAVSDQDRWSEDLTTFLG